MQASTWDLPTPTVYRRPPGPPAGSQGWSRSGKTPSSFRRSRHEAMARTPASHSTRSGELPSAPDQAAVFFGRVQRDTSPNHRARVHFFLTLMAQSSLEIPEGRSCGTASTLPDANRGDLPTLVGCYRGKAGMELAGPLIYLQPPLPALPPCSITCSCTTPARPPPCSCSWPHGST